MSAAAAYLLVPLVYALVLREKSLAHCKAQCLLILTIRQMAILSNLHFRKLPGYAADARRFYQDSLHGISWNNLVGTGKEFFQNMLAALFYVPGPSKDLALEFTFLGVGLVLIGVGRLCAALGHSQKAGTAVLIVGLSPAAICYTSSILREVWQQLFLVASSLAVVVLRKKFSPKALALLGVSLLTLGCLQKGLALYSVLFGVLAFLFLTQSGKTRGPILAVVTSVLILGGYLSLLGGSQIEVESSSVVVDAFTEGEILDYAVDYRGSLNEARANYADHLELETGTQLLVATPQLIAYYWLCPLPWQLSEYIDLVAFSENAVRTGLLLLGLFGTMSKKKEEKAQLGFLWAAFLILELMFAVGTGNWGTAARHRTVGLPLFTVISLAGMSKKRESTTDEAEVKFESLSRREQIRRRRRRQRLKEPSKEQTTSA